jgi:hypothetical protein
MSILQTSWRKWSMVLPWSAIGTKGNRRTNYEQKGGFNQCLSWSSVSPWSTIPHHMYCISWCTAFHYLTSYKRRRKQYAYVKAKLPSILLPDLRPANRKEHISSQSHWQTRYQSMCRLRTETEGWLSKWRVAYHPSNKNMLLISANKHVQLSICGLYKWEIRKFRRCIAIFVRQTTFMTNTSSVP